MFAAESEPPLETYSTPLTWAALATPPRKYKVPLELTCVPVVTPPEDRY